MRCSAAAGNKCMRVAFRLIRLLERHQIPWILDHPRSSRAWWIPTLVRLEKQSHITKTVLHQCKYGTEWQKGNCPFVFQDQRAEPRAPQLQMSRTWQPLFSYLAAAHSAPGPGSKWKELDVDRQPLPSQAEHGARFLPHGRFRALFLLSGANSCAAPSASQIVLAPGRVAVAYGYNMFSSSFFNTTFFVQPWDTTRASLFDLSTTRPTACN